MLDPARLHGRVTLVPAVNEPAFLRGARTAEDGLDLARTCPGRPDGSVTERIAYELSRLILAADLYIDLHSGGVALEILPLVDALEVFNARSFLRGPDQRAAALGLEAGLLATAGSDAHSYLEVGRAVLRLPPFRDPESFREALAKAHIHARRSSPLVHVLSRYASFRKGLGWRGRAR
jgi:predicted deacylase